MFGNVFVPCFLFFVSSFFKTRNMNVFHNYFYFLKKINKQEAKIENVIDKCFLFPDFLQDLFFILFMLFYSRLIQLNIIPLTLSNLDRNVF